MILTCTMNPAIDLFIRTEYLTPKKVNRTSENDIQPNGKGVNVSFILKMLGLDNTATGFIGGFTGEFIKEELEKKEIETDFVPISEITRINVFTNVLNEKTEYKIVNKGPNIKKESLNDLMDKLSKLEKNDLLIVSGSSPEGVTDEDLLEIAKLAKKKEIRLAIDTSSKILLDILHFEPYCIKPNDEELMQLFNLTELTTDDIIYYGKQLVGLGAKQVIISLGENGAYLFNQNEILVGNAPKGELVNSACAGDTMLATFIGLQELGKTTEESLKTAIAAASSTAFTEGLTDFLNVPLLEKEITIKKVRG